MKKTTQNELDCYASASTGRAMFDWFFFSDRFPLFLSLVMRAITPPMDSQAYIDSGHYFHSRFPHDDCIDVDTQWFSSARQCIATPTQSERSMMANVAAALRAVYFSNRSLYDCSSNILSQPSTTNDDGNDRTSWHTSAILSLPLRMPHVPQIARQLVPAPVAR